MTIILVIFGLFIAAFSAWGLVAPQRMVNTVLAAWHKPSGMTLAVGVRVVIGVLCILAAPETKWPLFFEILGWLMLVAAALIPVIGKERLTRFIMWWVKMPPPGIRVWLLIGLGFGLLFIYGAI